MKTTFALDVYVPLIDINEIIAVLEKPINDDAEAIMTKKKYLPAKFTPMNFPLFCRKNIEILILPGLMPGCIGIEINKKLP